jgi:hypothetical protein
MSWEIALKFTGIKLELLRDFSMINFFESSIRGGISNINVRYFQTDCPTDEVTTSTRHAMYWDANGLYSKAMLYYLPYGDFKWLDRTAVVNFDVTAIAHNAKYAYFIEVDVEYPACIHDKHADLPFFPKRERLKGMNCPPWPGI